MAASPPDPFLAALDALEEALAANEERIGAMRQRIAYIREQRRLGRPYGEMVSMEQRPLLVELLATSARALDSAGARVRRTEATALYAEGVTMDEIAEMFGVSRQRVSAVLREGRGQGDG